MGSGELQPVSDELIIERAVAYAVWSDWQVVPANCRVEMAAGLLQTGRPRAWFAFMVARPFVPGRECPAAPGDTAGL